MDPPEFGATSEQIRLHLESHNIESRPVWKPMHFSRCSAHCRVRGGKVSAELFATGLCLPSGSAMSDAELRHVTTSIANVPRLAHRPLKTLR